MICELCSVEHANFSKEETMKDTLSNSKISVGMPVYNGERYIREAIDSLLAQSLTDFELIIADNASTDKTEEICRDYQDRYPQKVRYIRHEINQGVMKNFQFVLGEARGEYFMWAACDDRWDSNWLLRLFQLAEKNGNAMVFGRVEHIGVSGQDIDHIANGARFTYQAGRIFRRIDYFLKFEGLGKANVIYCLYNKSMRDKLKYLMDDLISGRCLYDYTMVFNMLDSAPLVCDDSVAIYKRARKDSEGEKMGFDNQNRPSFLKRLLRMFWPFPPNLISEYMQYSSRFEAIVLCILMPVKLALAYIFEFRVLLRFCRGL